MLILVQLAHFHGAIAGDTILVVRLLVLLVALRWIGRRMSMLELRPDASASPAPAGSLG
jgi:hypothetical protein